MSGDEIAIEQGSSAAASEATDPSQPDSPSPRSVRCECGATVSRRPGTTRNAPTAEIGGGASSEALVSLPCAFKAWITDTVTGKLRANHEATSRRWQ
jgi:hypothetical protein